MQIIDILIITSIISYGAKGAKSGFFKETVTLIGTILCFLLAWCFKNPVANFLSYNLPFTNFSGSIEGLVSLNIVMYQLIAFILLWILFMAVVQVLIKITNLFEKILKFTVVFSLPSKILGFVIGLIEGYIIMFCCLFFVKQPAFYLEAFEHSKLTPIIVNSSPGLSNVVSKTNDAIKDIYAVIKIYDKEDKDVVNEEIINILLDYKVIDENYLKILKEKGKIIYTKEG